jgi:dipeptidyl aminopeptidase/acylaminoacyl peptidase
VAFVWYRRHENADVFCGPCDGSRRPFALTHTPEFTWLVSWLPDSSGVLVEEDHGGDEFARLFRVALDRPQGMQPLTEDRPRYFIRGGNLSPDSKTLFYGANYDFSAGQPLEPTWIYRHDLVTGERRAIARPEKPIYMEVSLNRSGTHLLYSRKDRHPAGRQFHLVDVEGRADREILNFGDDVKTFGRWFPDGENILVLSEGTGQGKQVYQSLGIYHWPTDSLDWLIDDPGRSIESAWVSPDGTIIVDEIRGAVHRPSYLSPVDRLECLFPEYTGNLLPLGRAWDGAWIGMAYYSTSPRELVRFSFDASPAEGTMSSSSLTRVWELSPLKPEDLARASSFRWHSADGQEIQGWLYLASPNPCRAVIYIHGGPTDHSEDRLNPQIQYFVARGFNVLDVNYRGSTGFGLPFREMIKADGWGGREQADIAAGAEALIREGLAEPGRVGVTGTSYGGYSAWHQITHVPVEIIGAAAPVCGMTDLVVDYETTRPDLRPLSEEMIGGRPAEIPEKYAERSPINFIQDIRGKLLIVQGALDPNVTPENVSQVQLGLDAEGIPYELLIFEDEGHGIVKPANQERLYVALADFFDGALQ